eukprot:4578507-Amphidinium_carterae.1
MRSILHEQPPHTFHPQNRRESNNTSSNNWAAVTSRFPLSNAICANFCSYCIYRGIAVAGCSSIQDVVGNFVQFGVLHFALPLLSLTVGHRTR